MEDSPALPGESLHDANVAAIIYLQRCADVPSPVAEEYGGCMKSDLDNFAGFLRETYGITDSELRTLGLAFKGLTRKEIADDLSISVHTVDTHMTSIYSKLGVKNEVEAIMKIFGRVFPPLAGNFLCSD